MSPKLILWQIIIICVTESGPSLRWKKVEGPTTRLTFLDIVLDTITMEASITTERKSSLLTAIHSFCTLKKIKKCTKCELLSLIDKLSFACKVVPAGHIFCIAQLTLAVQSQNFTIIIICITYKTHLDLLRWSDFLPLWSELPWFLIPIGPWVQLCSYLQMYQGAEVGVLIG